jgi:predicted acylesterase/phospholipase RssA
MPRREPNSVQLFPLPKGRVVGRFDPAADPLYGRSLRIALALKGGSSLAVWIGGAVAELDLLRRIRWSSDGTCSFLWPVANLGPADDVVFERARVYAAALRSRGYDRVEIDALAGASAGGLNSVVYSVAQRVGAKLDSVLGLWVESGAFWTLLRTPGFVGVDSPLDGDGIFAHGVNDALNLLFRDTDAQVKSHRAEHIVVDLSATVIDTQDARDRVSRSGRGEFHFVGADRGKSHDANATDKELGRAIPRPDDTNVEESLARLAYAARATSSLPGGFEPALIYSSFSDVSQVAAKRIDFSRAFHVQRDGFSAPFRIIDGGLTDNIPIDRALRAVRGLASEVYSDRAIIYLNPAPDSTPLVRAPSTYIGEAVSPRLENTPNVRTDPSSRFLKVVARAVGLRAFAENADDKISQIEDFRMGLELAEARRRSVGARGVAGNETGYERANAHRDYAAYRGLSDADLVSEVLQNPAVWQLETDLPDRHSYDSKTTSELFGIETAFAIAYAAAADNTGPGDAGSGKADVLAINDPRNQAIFGGPVAVSDCAQCLLSWVRALEDNQFSGPMTGTTEILTQSQKYPSTREVRRKLYEVLEAATQERDRLLEITCTTVLAFDDGPPVDLKPVELFTLAIDSFLGAPTSEMRELMGDLDDLREVLATVTGWVTGPMSLPMWAGFPTKGAESALEVAAFCAGSGIPDIVSNVQFWEISAAAEAARSESFTELVEEDFRINLRSVLRLPRKSDITHSEAKRLFADRELSPDAKLTGLSLGSFAGFLSRDWRRNDWLWGRMDAASGVLTYLDSIPAPRAGLDLAGQPTELDAKRELAQGSIMREAAILQFPNVDSQDPADERLHQAPFSPPPESATATADDLRGRLVMGGDSILNLSPGYRVGLASRTVHVRCVRSGAGWPRRGPSSCLSS